ncbi:DUF4389 domain-containing protein [Kordiimonas pumila]|uniref:DUF4389 domain-containing protein n=1 Tax=Kordiimonas pumila TaxID=2161677 RepID=A0ABV7D1M5_9PROT|nr:DUF4389 domain-containing protein [Kordiimonas pumila]
MVDNTNDKAKPAAQPKKAAPVKKAPAASAKKPTVRKSAVKTSTAKPVKKAAAPKTSVPASKPAAKAKTTPTPKAPAKTMVAQKAAPKKTAATKPATKKAPEIKNAAANAGADNAKKTENTKQESPASFVDNLKTKDWLTILKRGLFMFVFGVIGHVVMLFTLFMALLQFCVALILDKPNENLTNGINIAGNYIKEVLEFLSFKTEELPFPFGRDLPKQ